MDQERQRLETRLIEKAWSDETFRAALLADPKGVIEAELGQALPRGITVKVVEETADTLYIRLPLNPEHLTDAMLDLVAGGSYVCPSGVLTCTRESCYTNAKECNPVSVPIR